MAEKLFDNNPVVVIMMATYNGAMFLEEQLDSIAKQTFQNWRIIVSDDGSTDGTLEILYRFQTLWGLFKIQIRRGPSKGFALNFLSLACDKTIEGDFYAYSDQDDVWLPNKLEAALELSVGHDTSIPYLYGGRSLYVDQNLNALQQSPLFVFPCSFRNALVQNYAGGNTMLFNHAAKFLLERAGVVNIPVHDWWTYLIVSGAGGNVYFDSRPFILYRQHANSLIGGNYGFISRLISLVSIIKGNFRYWTDLHLEALVKSKHLLSPQSIELLNVFIRLRKGTFFQRVRMIEVCGLYRQTWRGTLSLYFTAFFDKL